jgi:hypothetical protein
MIVKMNQKRNQKMMNKKAVHFGKAVFVIIFIIIALIATFFFVGREETPESIKDSLAADLPDPEFGINVDFCSHIDDDFNCEDKGNNVFKRGDDVWILIKLNNLKAQIRGDKYFVSYSQGREIFDPDNSLIGIVSGKIVDEEMSFNYDGYFDVNIMNHLSTDNSDDLGAYKVNMALTDKNIGEVINHNSEFRLS